MQEGPFPLYDLTFPIPLEHERQTPPQRWFVRKRKELDVDNFMAAWQDCAIGCKAWLFTETGQVEYIPNAHLRFRGHGAVVIGRLCLVAAFPSLRTEYDDWDKNSFDDLVACELGQTISGKVMCLTCVVRIYPFQLSRLKRLSKVMEIPRLQGLMGAHMRCCLKEGDSL